MSDASDQLEVVVDGTIVHALKNADFASYETDYTVLEVDLSEHADGQPHTVMLRGRTGESSSSFGTDILIDEVSLMACAP